MIELNLSQTALGKSACILNLYRTVVQGYKEPAESANIVYGEAVHKYIDIMYKTRGHIPTAREEALKVFDVPKVDKPKQLHLSDRNHMLTTCFNVWEMYVKNDTEFEVIELDGKPATEITFSIIYYQDEYIKVSIAGTIDSIGKIKGGCYAIRDWKTTSSWDSKGYFGQYELSRQLRFYRLALKFMSDMYPDSVLGQIGKTKVGAFIDGIFVKPAAGDNKFGRSEVFQYDDQELSEFRQMLDELCKRISRHIKYKHYPKEGILNGSCIGKYGRCIFWNVCNVRDNISEVLLKRDFKQVPFNPLNYSGR